MDNSNANHDSSQNDHGVDLTKTDHSQDGLADMGENIDSLIQKFRELTKRVHEKQSQITEEFLRNICQDLDNFERTTKNHVLEKDFRLSLDELGKRYHNILDEFEKKQNQNTIELEQQNTLIEKIKSNYIKQKTLLEKELKNLQLQYDIKTQNEKEMTQEKLLSEKISEHEHKRLVIQSKRFYISIALIGIFVTVGFIAFFNYQNQVFLEASKTILTGYNSQYLIQNLKGDVVNTWVSWNILPTRILDIGIVNSANLSEDKIAAVKDAILSDKVVQIDDSLLHKGPKGQVSTYYAGWKGALDTVSESNTKLAIPVKFNVIESNSGVGDVMIILSTDTNPDGLSGLTKSVTDSHQILRSTITIFNAQNLSAQQLNAIVRHEFGHAMGLAHSTAPEDLMHATIQTDYPYISGCDMDAIHTLYDGGQSSQVICKK